LARIKTGEIHLEYDVHGDEGGETVLLIMGLGAQMTRWSPVFVEKLATKGFRVVRYDNRDVGLSDKLDAAGPPDMPALLTALSQGRSPDVAYDLSHMAGDAVALLDALGIRRAHIVGASMGGMIAQLVATDHPQRTLSLTSIMSSTGRPDLPRATPEAMARLTTPTPDPHVDLEAYLAHSIASSRVMGSPAHPAPEEELRQQAVSAFHRSYYPVGFQRQYAAILASAPRHAKLASVKAPTVVIHGQADPLVPIEAGRDTAAVIPNAELLEIPGMGHDLPPPLYDTVVDAIVRVAERSRATQSA
jgi:pimeloyl-ACP methyl ester carboxylesterase